MDPNTLSTADLAHAWLFGQVFGPIIALGIAIVIACIIAVGYKIKPTDPPK